MNATQNQNQIIAGLNKIGLDGSPGNGDAVWVCGRVDRPCILPSGRIEGDIDDLSDADLDAIGAKRRTGPQGDYLVPADRE